MISVIPDFVIYRLGSVCCYEVVSRCLPHYVLDLRALRVDDCLDSERLIERSFLLCAATYRVQVNFYA